MTTIVSGLSKIQKKWASEEVFWKLIPRLKLTHCVEGSLYLSCVSMENAFENECQCFQWHADFMFRTRNTPENSFGIQLSSVCN